jgi:hypothetical protein
MDHLHFSPRRAAAFVAAGSGKLAQIRVFEGRLEALRPARSGGKPAWLSKVIGRPYGASCGQVGEKRKISISRSRSSMDTLDAD